MDKLKTFLSKKLFVTILAGIAAPAMVTRGVPIETVNWLIGLAGAYIAGQSAVDAVAKREPEVASTVVRPLSEKGV